jgi:hypothetical protein
VAPSRCPPAPTFKSTFGYHPILAFLDNSGEFLAGLLLPGNAGANTAADHITVLDQAGRAPPCRLGWRRSRVLGGPGSRWSPWTVRAAERPPSPLRAA